MVLRASKIFENQNHCISLAQNNEALETVYAGKNRFNARHGNTFRSISCLSAAFL